MTRAGEHAQPAAAPAAELPTGWRGALATLGPMALVLWLLALGAVAWAAYRWLDPTPAKHLVIATGPEQGAYAEFAKRYVPLLQAHGLRVELRTTQGSAENLALLRDAGSGVMAAFVQGGVQIQAGAEDSAAAPDSADPVVSLGSVAYEPLWLFVRDDAVRRRLGRAALTRLSQLDGWSLHTGPDGGGARPLFEQLLAANGLAPAQLQLDTSPTVQGVVALVQGRVDGLVMVSAPDAPLVQYLLRTPGVSLMPFEQAAAYTRRFPFLRALSLPRGLVDLAADLPPRDLPLVAATTSLLAREDLHPALVQLLVQAARQAHGEPGWFQATEELPNPQAAGWPLAPEAERVYREGRPWLQRYLPFWLANFIDRMWIVLLPLLAALLPLSRVLPPLVDMRFRSRVFRWYAHLRAIEKDLERPGADLVRLRERLERLDSQVEGIGLPLSYTHELYQLRAHIHLVRKRLVVKGGGVAESAAEAASEAAAESPASG